MDLEERRFDEARAKLMEAIELQRKANAALPHQPSYRQELVRYLRNLIRAAEGLGRTDEADAARRELAELVASDPAMIAALDGRLSAVLAGQPPKDELERLALAYRAHEKSLH